jgi:polysaccharide export outer membrane protein
MAHSQYPKTGVAIIPTHVSLVGISAALIALVLAEVGIAAQPAPRAEAVVSLQPGVFRPVIAVAQRPPEPEVQKPVELHPVEPLPAEAVTPQAVGSQIEAIAYPPYAALPTPCPRCGVPCCGGNCCAERTWDSAAPIPWEVFAQGEYVGPPRLPHVPEYRIRTDDVLEFAFRLTAEPSPRRYRLQTGDQLRFDALSAEEYSRDGVVVEPDGYISLPFGQVSAAGLTLEQLRKTLENRLAEEGVQEPRVAIAPAFVQGTPTVNTRLKELRNTVDARQAVTGGQATRARVTPEGTVQLPAIGSVPATGLTLAELEREIEYRYGQIVDGIEVTPALFERAPRYVYVLGEVATPGRYTLEGPTTLMQAISLAGGWNVGAHLKGIVVFRRDDNWQLMATKLDLHKPLFGKRPCPADEIWIRDSDIVLVPQSAILATDNFIELVFTRGIYGVFPFNNSFSWSAFVLRNSRGFVPSP